VGPCVMKIVIEKEKVKIEYKRHEWNKIEDIYRNAGLERYMTSTFLGRYIATVYRYRSDSRRVFGGNTYEISQLGRTITVYYYGDINDPLIAHTCGPNCIRVNLAIFRAVPQCNDSVCVTEVIPPEPDSLVIPNPKETLVYVAMAFKAALARLLGRELRARYRLEVVIE